MVFKIRMGQPDMEALWEDKKRGAYERVKLSSLPPTQ